MGIFDGNNQRAKYALPISRPIDIGATEAFRPQKKCPKNDVFLFFWGLMRVERGGMDLVWVKSVFWFVKYVDFYVIFL